MNLFDLNKGNPSLMNKSNQRISPIKTQNRFCVLIEKIEIFIY